jgi:ribosomal protein L16 Arg81 hydroxylase
LDLMSPLKLADLLAPISIADFLSEHWGKRPLHARGQAGRFAPVFDRLAFERLLQSLGDGPHDAEGVQLRCQFPHEKWIASGMTGRRPSMPARASQAPVLLAAGSTLEFFEVQRGNVEVDALIARVRGELGFAGRVSASLWVSTRETGVNQHFDAQSVVVLQLEGRKRWLLSSRPALQWPYHTGHLLPDGTIGYGSQESDAWEKEVDPIGPSESIELTMEPGDLLFLPAGTYHQTKSVGSEQSLALHLFFHQVGFWEVAEELLRGKLAAQPDWRHLPLLPDADYSGELPKGIREFFYTRMMELALEISETSDDDFNRAWQTLIASTGPSVKPRPAPAATVSREQRLRFTPGATVTWMQARGAEGEELTLLCGKNDVSFDEELFEFGRQLHAHRDGFAAGEATGFVPKGAPRLAWERVEEMLSALIENGVLTSV